MRCAQGLLVSAAWTPVRRACTLLFGGRCAELLPRHARCVHAHSMYVCRCMCACVHASGHTPAAPRLGLCCRQCCCRPSPSTSWARCWRATRRGWSGRCSRARSYCTGTAVQQYSGAAVHLMLHRAGRSCVGMHAYGYAAGLREGAGAGRGHMSSTYPMARACLLSPPPLPHTHPSWPACSCAVDPRLPHHRQAPGPGKT